MKVSKSTLKFWYNGIPLFGMLLFGVPALSTFLKVRQDEYSNTKYYKMLTKSEREEVRRVGQETENMSDEEKLDLILKTFDIDDWQQVRIPRPGEVAPPPKPIKQSAIPVEKKL